MKTKYSTLIGGKRLASALQSFDGTRVNRGVKARLIRPLMATLACSIVLVGAIPTGAIARGFGQQGGPTVTEQWPGTGLTRTTTETKTDSNGNQVTTTTHYDKDGTTANGDQETTYGLPPNNKLVIKKRLRIFNADPKTHQPTQETTDYFDVANGAVTGGTRTNIKRDDNGNDLSVDTYNWVPDPKEPGGGHWQKTSSTPLKVDGGLLRTEIQTKNGVLMVNLPQDMAAGDTITGTVIAEPAGKTAKEQEQNSDELKGYVVSVADQKSTPGKPYAKWLIPAAAGSVLALLVLDKHGHTVAEPKVPILTDTPMPPIRTTPPTESDFHLPTIGQAGKPITITGPFAGDATTTNVSVGGQAIPVLAESPREAVAMAPKATGPSKIEVDEQGVSAVGAYRNVGCKLSAGKTALQVGETEPMSLEVTGLADLKEPISVVLQNNSPTVVGVQGGDRQTIQCSAAAVDAEGSFAKTLTLTGRQLGGFSIGVHLDESQVIQIGNKKFDMPLGEPTEEEKKQDRIDGTLMRADEKHDQVEKDKENHKGSDYLKELMRVAADAQADADALLKGMSAADRKKTCDRMAKSYRTRAEADRKMRDEAKQRAQDDRDKAANASDPKEKAALQNEADKADESAKFYDDLAIQDDAHATDYDNKGK